MSKDIAEDWGNCFFQSHPASLCGEGPVKDPGTSLCPGGSGSMVGHQHTCKHRCSKAHRNQKTDALFTDSLRTQVKRSGFEKGVSGEPAILHRCW